MLGGRGAHCGSGQWTRSRPSNSTSPRQLSGRGAANYPDRPACHSDQVLARRPRRPQGGAVLRGQVSIASRCASVAASAMSLMDTISISTRPVHAQRAGKAASDSAEAIDGDFGGHHGSSCSAIEASLAPSRTVHVPSTRRGAKCQPRVKRKPHDSGQTANGLGARLRLDFVTRVQYAFTVRSTGCRDRGGDLLGGGVRRRARHAQAFPELCRTQGAWAPSGHVVLPDR